MNSLAQSQVNPVASSVATTLPTPPTDERRSSPTSKSSYQSMSTSVPAEQPRRSQTDSLPPFSLPQVSRSYSPSTSNLGGSLPTPPPGENYPPSSSYSGYTYSSQSTWPTSAPHQYSVSMSEPNPNTNSPGGSYRGMSPSSNAYPMQPVSSAYNAYGGSPHSPPSRDSRNNSPYHGEYLPAPQGSSLYGQSGQHQGEQGHYQSYPPPANLPPLQQHNAMVPQHAASYQSSGSSNGSPYGNAYLQYSQVPTVSLQENSNLPPPLTRPLPAHMSSHQYQQPYQQPPSSYPSSQPYVGGPSSSSWRFSSPPMHSSTDPGLRNSPYARPGGMMRPGSGGMVVNNQDRPFKCDQCPQSFNRNHDLKRHKRIHLAVKPFPCPSCDKSFSRKDALKVVTPPSEPGTDSIETYIGKRMWKWKPSQRRSATRQ